MKHLDLFSGIGGFALAVDSVWPGSEHVFVDNDLFCQAILKKHWPNAPIYGDIRKFITDTERTHLRGKSRNVEQAEQQNQGKPEIPRQLWNPSGGQDTTILTGGFPCQPFSHAGRRKGTDDNRYLWPEMFRVIQLTQPTWVIAENVRGLVTWSSGLVLEQVCADLEGEGYEVQPIILPAVAVNAPHRRDRIWFIAFNTKHDGRNGSQDGQGSAAGSDGNEARTDEVQQPPRSDRQGDETGSWNQNWLEIATKLCTLDDGLPNGLARPRGWRNAALKGAGNAIVPQVAIEIMKAMKVSLQAD